MSGVETRPVPVNILSWPRTRDLITQHKAIYVSLYYNPDTTACGCYLLGVNRLAADLSMTPDSLDDALDEFARRGLILRDKKTGEIFVSDWPRWHRFGTSAARGALWTSISKIQSRDLWIKVESSYKSIPSPCKGKVKDKASSKEEGGSLGQARLPPGWRDTEAGTRAAAALLHVSDLPQESWAEFRARIQAASDAQWPSRISPPGHRAPHPAGGALGG
ncbi:hypothetical protein R11007_02811 [Ralstonia holmesii]|nr:hypothetical protein R11007_02811 [Ralstonia sp. LMG 32967]